MLTAPELQNSKTRLLEAALNALAAGVVLTEGDAQVVYMNDAARQQLRTGHALRLFNNRLSPTDPSAARALNAALARIRDKSELVQTLALPDGEGAGLVATIMPLDGETGGGPPFSAAAAIFIQDPAPTPPFPGEAFARLYGLTPAELRVIRAMTPGATLPQVARTLGIAVPTAKTHLKHIFEKTHTTRQADIVALMSRATGPARAAGIAGRTANAGRANAAPRPALPQMLRRTDPSCV